MEKLQLHYYLENNVHSMNAFARNKAELELLRLLNHISKSLNLDLEFEAEALSEGGINQIFKIINKKKNRKYVVILGFLGGVFTEVLTNVASDYISKNPKLEEQLIEKNDLEIKKLKLEIKNLEKLDEDDVNDKTIDSLQNIIEYFLLEGKSRVLKSNFYTYISDEKKVTQISAQVLNEISEPVSDEKIVKRSSFKKFIIEEVVLDPKNIIDAEIEIVSPVFKIGNDKWKGNFNGELIDFVIKDKEFKQKVLNRQVSFTRGTLINCELEIILVLDKKGEQKIKSRFAYDITIKK